MEPDHAGPGQDGNARVVLQAVDQIARHVGAELSASDHHRNGACLVGQEHGRLPRRVAATDHYDGVAGAQFGLQVGGGVINASVFELGQPVDIEPSVAGAGGRDHRSPGHGGAVGQFDDEVAGFFAQGYGGARRAQLSSELLRLDEPTFDQVGPRDPRGEAEVVLIRELLPAWPPGATMSRARVRRPSEAP